MDENFVKERITHLRLKKGVSEYQMSYDLGHSRGYVYNISSGKALPPLMNIPPQGCGETAPCGAQPPLKWCIHSA